MVFPFSAGFGGSGLGFWGGGCCIGLGWTGLLPLDGTWTSWGGLFSGDCTVCPWLGLPFEFAQKSPKLSDGEVLAVGLVIPAPVTVCFGIGACWELGCWFEVGTLVPNMLKRLGFILLPSFVDVFDVVDVVEGLLFRFCAGWFWGTWVLGLVLTGVVFVFVFGLGWVGCCWVGWDGGWGWDGGSFGFVVVALNLLLSY